MARLSITFPRSSTENMHDSATWFLSVHRAHNSNKLEASVDKQIKVQFKRTETEKLGNASLEETS